MRIILATMIVVLMAGAGAANAAISAEWVVNPGCTIAGYTTHDLMITTDSDWISARLELILCGGTIYQDPMYNQEYPQATIWGFVPVVEWDSMFSAPDYEVPGFTDQAGDGWTSISVKRSWFNTEDTGPGTFVGARTTVSDSTVTGIYNGLLYERSNPDVPVVFSSWGYLYLSADADGPYVINEGDTLTLDASRSWDEYCDILLYKWDLDDDGVFETNVYEQSVFLVDYAYLESLGLGVCDPGESYDICLEVENTYHFSDRDYSTLTIIPEPVTPVLLGLGALALIRRHRSM